MRVRRMRGPSMPTPSCPHDGRSSTSGEPNQQRCGCRAHAGRAGPGPQDRHSAGVVGHEDPHGGGGQSHRHTTLGARVIDCVADQFMRDQHRVFDPHRRGQRRHRHPRGPHSTADRPVRDGSSLHAGARARDARNCRRSRSRSARWGSANKPSTPVNNRTSTSKSRFATAHPPGRVRESHPGAVPAANGTRADRRSHPHIWRPQHARP